MRIGLIGFGGVGKAFIRLLQEKSINSVSPGYIATPMSVDTPEELSFKT